MAWRWLVAYSGVDVEVVTTMDKGHVFDQIVDEIPESLRRLVSEIRVSPSVYGDCSETYPYGVSVSIPDPTLNAFRTVLFKASSRLRDDEVWIRVEDTWYRRVHQGLILEEFTG